MADGIGEMIEGIGLGAGSFSMAGMGKPLLIGLLILLFGSLMAVGVYFLIKYIRFNKTIILFQKIGGKVIPTAIDKGMFQRIGSAGDYWMITRKFKKILPRPKILMGKNQYYFFEREDGEWINFSIEDIDMKMKKAEVYYIDEDMRLQRLGIYKNLEARFQKVGFWEKYGAYIVMAITVLILLVCVIILFKSMTEHWDKMGSVANAMTEMARSVDAMATRVGGGVKPA